MNPFSACATQAIINCLLNVNSEDIKLGEELEGFMNFTSGFDPAVSCFVYSNTLKQPLFQNRGLCLGNSESIRTVHNSFARPTVYELDIRGTGKEDNFHFITYIPVNGHVYELDGLREAPIDLGPIAEGEDWLKAVRPIINRRIEKYTEGEIHFNLMALISDRRLKYQQQLDKLVEVRFNYFLFLVMQNNILFQAGMDTDESANEICRLQMLIQEEEEKWERYRKENVRRRHNYVPFIVELLKILAKEQKLVPLVEKAISQAEKRAAAKTGEK